MLPRVASMTRLGPRAYAALAPTAARHGAVDAIVSAATSRVRRAIEKPAAGSWNEAVQQAETLVHPKGGSVLDARALVGNDLALITSNIKKLVASDHPALATISSYYFEQGGKHFRPLIVLLISRALAALKPPTADGQINTEILASQRRLAEITEMIHTASLLHDDVIDVADTRRNQASANVQFGNKLAVLAGDFLLARASLALAQLRNTDVVEMLAVVIANLVEGEFMQLKVQPEQALSFDYYIQKTYLKTATLIAKSCQAAALLGNYPADVCDIAYNYGRNIGIAFQLVDDVLDVTGTDASLGKPASVDLKLGLATAPVLFAAESYPQLIPLIKRQFVNPGDAELARELIAKSDGVKRTMDMATKYCQTAIDQVSKLPPSDARAALVDLAYKVIVRSK